MSNLIDNLQSIYQTKLQIKEVIETESDVFSEYPQLIEEAIEGGGEHPSGYAYVTANGDWNIRAYEMVNVEVPVPPGYIVPSGSYSIVENGTFDVNDYENAVVAVPASAVTSGTKEVTENGDYDVTTYQTVTVVVEGQTEYPYKDIVENGHVNVASYGFAYVAVPIDWDEVESYGYIVPDIRHIHINDNHSTTLASDNLCDGFDVVYVDVPVDWSEVASYGYIVPAGTYNIVENGTFDVNDYENAVVAVPASAVVIGTYNATENGVHNITNYAAVDVEVPIDWDAVETAGYVVPTGTYNITANGSYAVSAYANVNVSVPAPAPINDGLTLDTAYTVKEAIEFINSLSDNETTVDTMYVKGIISDVIYTFSSSYPTARLHISDDGVMYKDSGNNVDYKRELFVYSVHYKGWDGVTNWDASLNPQAVVGDSVVVYAQLKKQVDAYGTKPSTQNGSLYRHDKNVAGMLTVNSNGKYDSSLYNSVSVFVPGSSGIININSNGQFDVTSYETAFVSVPSKVRGDILGVFSSSDIGNEHNIELYLEPGYYNETEGTDPVAYTYWTSEIPLREDYNKSTQPLLVDKFIVNYMPAQTDENHEYQNPYRLHLNNVYIPFYPTGSELGDTPWTLTGVWNPNDKSVSQIAMVPDDYQPLIGDSDFANKEAEVNMSQCEGDIVPSSVVLLVKKYTTGPDVNKWYVSVTIDGTVI